MKTSYEGCHPEIADSLKRGEHRSCNVGENHYPVTIVAYCIKENPSRPYLSSGGSYYANAEPVKTETYVIDAVSMMEGLIESGYKPDREGYFIPSGEPKNISCFTLDSWIKCGKRKENDGHLWEPWMLEEREVE